MQTKSDGRARKINEQKKNLIEGINNFSCQKGFLCGLNYLYVPSTGEGFNFLILFKI